MCTAKYDTIYNNLLKISGYNEVKGRTMSSARNADCTRLVLLIQPETERRMRRLMSKKGMKPNELFDLAIETLDELDKKEAKHEG